MNEKTFKYWIYYIHDVDKDFGTKSKQIYAYTTDKELAEEFESERDMDVIHKKTKRLTAEEAHILWDRYRGSLLSKTELLTHDGNRCYNYEFVVTLDEKMLITHIITRLLTIDIYVWCWQNPEIFNKELENALDVLGYREVHNYISSENKVSKKDYIEENDIPIKIDELKLFLQNFGNTMKG